MIQVLASILSLSFAMASPTDAPIRLGLGFPVQVAPQFNDENILSSIRYAVENSGVAPVVRIKLDGSADKISVMVIGDRGAKQFTFVFEEDKAVLKKGPLTETILHQVDIPFGSLQTHGFKQNERLDYSAAAAWIAVGVVGIYAAKKILNKLTVGRFSNPESFEHKSLFPNKQEMHEEIATHRQLLKNAIAKTEEALEAQLVDVVKPLARLAACGHNHGLGGERENKPTQFQCEAVEAPEAEAARKTLLKAFPRYASAFGRDFYKELVAPLVDLIRNVKNTETRRQMWTFFDLISRRMIQERGFGAAVATGLFVGTGQVIIEILESFVLPAGAHMYCQVGNAAVMALAAKTYTTYFCLTQHQEFREKSLSDRWRVAQQIARLSKTSAITKSDTEKSIHALHLLFRLVERDVRHARNLGDLKKPESRELARRLGLLRRDLTVLSIRLLHDSAADGAVKQWLQTLYDVQTVLHDPKACAALLSPAA